MTNSPTSSSNLVPRIRHLAFEQALARAGVPPDQRPAIEPLCGELVVTYAFDLPDQFVMATDAQIEQCGLNRADRRKQAVQNLRAAMRRDGLDVRFHQPQAPVIEVRSGGDVEACLLLIDDFWTHVQAQFGSPVVAAVPRRDALLIVCAPDDAALRELQRQASLRLHSGNDPHGLSAQAMRRVGQEWHLLGDA